MGRDPSTPSANPADSAQDDKSPIRKRESARDDSLTLTCAKEQTSCKADIR